MKISVKGMMCGHCEMHVKKALEAVDGIANVSASHETGTVTFETSNEVDEKFADGRSCCNQNQPENTA